MRNETSTFWGRVDKTDDCWNWTGGITGRGYGAFYVDGAQRPAHRHALEMAMGASVPTDLDVDHLCRNRRCVRPEHLEPVTRRENLLRSPITLTSQKAAQTHCVHGHEFTDANTAHRKNGTRACRTCQRDRDRAFKARKRAA